MQAAGPADRGGSFCSRPPPAPAERRRSHLRRGRRGWGPAASNGGGGGEGGRGLGGRQRRRRHSATLASLGPKCWLPEFLELPFFWMTTSGLCWSRRGAAKCLALSRWHPSQHNPNPQPAIPRSPLTPKNPPSVASIGGLWGPALEDHSVGADWRSACRCTDGASLSKASCQLALAGVRPKLHSCKHHCKRHFPGPSGFDFPRS